MIGYLVRPSQMHCRSLRDPTLLDLPPVTTGCGETSFRFSAARDWNSLPKEIRELKTLVQFKNEVLKYLINMDAVTHNCSL